MSCFFGCKRVKGGLWLPRRGKWMYTCVKCEKKHYLDN